MHIKQAFTALLASALSFNWNSSVLADVVFKYDPFEDRTTITLFGEQSPQKPLLHASHQSNGQKPDVSESAMVGFITSQACTDPNFIADGQRVQPKPGTDSPLTPHMIPMDYGEGDRRLPGTYSFNFYEFSQVKQIATAKSVQYKLCDRVFNLSSQDRAELRKFLNYFSKE